MLQGRRFGQGVAVLPHLLLAVELMEEDLGMGKGGRAKAGGSWGWHCAVPQFPLLALWQTLPIGPHLAKGTVTLCPLHLPAGPAAVAQPWSGSAGIKQSWTQPISPMLAQEDEPGEGVAICRLSR